MLFVLLPPVSQEALSLASALRSAGHSVREAVPDTDDGPDGPVAPDAVLSSGPLPTPGLKALAGLEPAPCVLALVEREALAGWKPDPAFHDFVVAPFRAAEVAARVALYVCRRRQNNPEMLTSGGLVIDVGNYSVYADGERIELTFKEYELLKFLVGHSGRVFTREALLERVWGYDYWGGSRTIDVHIRRIRGKLPAHVAACIETVHQVGYRYAAPRP